MQSIMIATTNTQKISYMQSIMIATTNTQKKP